jgi:RimJ/RimL family protein N-acetyltransferase
MRSRHQFAYTLFPMLDTVRQGPVLPKLPIGAKLSLNKPVIRWMSDWRSILFPTFCSVASAGMSVVVSPISISNAESFYDCLDVVAREGQYLAQTKAQPLEKIQEFVRGSVFDDAVQFVALDNTRVVGWADIFPAWPDAISHRGTLGMGVLPDYRRHGIGEALLRACIDKAKLKGITRIEIETRVDNLPSIRLYEKLDFLHEAVKRNGMRFDGVYFDTVQMSFIL